MECKTVREQYYMASVVRHEKCVSSRDSLTEFIDEDPRGCDTLQLVRYCVKVPWLRIASTLPSQCYRLILQPQLHHQHHPQHHQHQINGNHVTGAINRSCDAPARTAATVAYATGVLENGFSACTVSAYKRAALAYTASPMNPLPAAQVAQKAQERHTSLSSLQLSVSL